MTMTSALSQTAASIGLFLISAITCGAFPELPAFQDPKTGVRYPGKLIWADLFTEDIETSTEFYTTLLGWKAEKIEADGESYTVFRLNGRPIAGMIYRPAFDRATSKGTWLPYFSVENLSESLSVVAANGGRVDVPIHHFPNRGEQAIARDNELALVGLMQTTHGDPDDYLAEYGEWIWAQLWVRNPSASIAFYRAVLGFEEVEGNPDDSNIYTHAFATNGTYRATLEELPESKPDARPGWLIFLRVEDLKETLDRVPGLGGNICLEPDPEIREGALAIIEDPSGAGVVLLEYEPPTEDRP